MRTLFIVSVLWLFAGVAASPIAAMDPVAAQSQAKLPGSDTAEVGLASRPPRIGRLTLDVLLGRTRVAGMLLETAQTGSVTSNSPLDSSGAAARRSHGARIALALPGLHLPAELRLDVEYVGPTSGDGGAEGRSRLPVAVAIRPGCVAALDELNATSAGPWRVRWDEATGLPARLDGSHTEPMGHTAEEAASGFIRAHAKLLGVEQLDRSLVGGASTASLGGRHVRFRQLQQGLPVLDAELSVHLDSQLRVHAVNSSYVPGLRDVAPKPELDRDEAMMAARRAARLASEPRATPSAELAVFAGSRPPALAWHVVLPSREPLADFDVVLDAASGKLLSLRDRLRHVEGRGRVFDPNPVVTLHDAGLADAEDADLPAFAKAYREVALQGLDGSGFLRGPFVDVTLGQNHAQSDDGSFVYDRSQKGFEQVMAYYHIDRAQRYLQSLGFTRANNRVQRVNAHEGPGDSSYYSPASRELNFGDGGVDDAEDADVINHEYGHALQDDQVHGFGASAQGGAMGEGFGDYWAATMRSDLSSQRECVAGWDATGFSSENPPCLRRLDSPKHYPEDLGGEVHSDGELWSACLWQIWNATGKAVADKLIVESHFALAPNSTFADGAAAILQADNLLFQAAHLAALKDIFAARGILEFFGRLRLGLRDAVTGTPAGGRVTIHGVRNELQADPATGLLDTDLHPGTYQVDVTSFGYRPVAGRTVTIQEDRTSELALALEPLPRFTVRGVVRRADTGETWPARVQAVDTPLPAVATDASSEGAFALTLPAGIYTLKASAFGVRSGLIRNVNVTADRQVDFELQKPAPVLLVDGSRTVGLQRYFVEALGADGCEVWTAGTDGPVTLEGLLAYPVVVWFTGVENGGPLSEQDRLTLRQYLGCGGRLFLTGSEIAYTLRKQPFLKEVLGAALVADAAEGRQVTGEGLSFAIEGGDGAANQQYPDVVKAVPGVSEMLRYDGGEGAGGLKVERGPSRIVFFSFGFEAIDTAEHRLAAMRLVRNWLEPSFEQLLLRLAALDRLRREAPAEERERWLLLEESYEHLMAQAISRLGRERCEKLTPFILEGELAQFKRLREAVLRR